MNNWNDISKSPNLLAGKNNWERIFEIKKSNDYYTIKTSLDKDIYEDTGKLCFKNIPKNITYWRELV